MFVWAKNYSTNQPDVCLWPSKTMSLYFDFQNEIISAMLGSEINEKRFITSKGQWGLFSERVLTLNGSSVLDLAANSIWRKTRSIASVATTSTVLLLMAFGSVVQSNVEWLVMLFKDRPIVRDYKTMLDIETSLFEVAYFLSQHVNLVISVEWNIYDSLENVIKKYQNLWLFTNEWTIPISKWFSLADVMLDMVEMNARMKQFILIWWNIWSNWLSNYRWCFWGRNKNNCSPVIKFDKKAIEQLREDYKNIRAFWACNLYAKNFKNTISKSVKNNIEHVEVAFQDVNDAILRLKSALLWAWRRNLKKDRCNMSEYEMAQLRAYWWWDWTCEQWILNEQVSLPINFTSLKKAQKSQKEKTKNLWKNAAENSSKDSLKVKDKIKYANSTQERQQIVSELYWNSVIYNSEYSLKMDNNFSDIFDSMMSNYNQSQQNASAWDLSYELIKIRWLVDQVEKVRDISAELEKTLKKIADYQCSN